MVVGVAPRMHSISGCSRVGHLQRGKYQEHGRSHDGMVSSSVHLLSFPSFMSVQHLVLGIANSVLAIYIDYFGMLASVEVVYVFICAA